MKRQLFLGALIVPALLMSLTIAANAAIRCINPDASSGCDSVIQNVINASANGDTILIYPGTYHHNIIINKSLAIRGMGGPGEVNIFIPNGDAITMAAGSTNTYISNLTITAQLGNGIYCAQMITLYVSNCVIQHCGVTGIYLHSGSGTIYVSNCVIFANSVYGINGSGDYPYRGSLYLYGNIFYRNSSAGIYFCNPNNGYNLNEYNCVFDNNPNYGCNAAPGPGNISLDPQFVVADSGDFHLQSSSPCINTGRQGLAYYDCDGSFNDMGVYGGPYAWCGPGPVVTDLQIIPSTVVKGETFRIQATGVSR